VCRARSNPGARAADEKRGFGHKRSRACRLWGGGDHVCMRAEREPIVCRHNCGWSSAVSGGRSRGVRSVGSSLFSTCICGLRRGAYRHSTLLSSLGTTHLTFRSNGSCVAALRCCAFLSNGAETLAAKWGALPIAAVGTVSMSGSHPSPTSVPPSPSPATTWLHLHRSNGSCCHTRLRLSVADAVVTRCFRLPWVGFQARSDRLLL
jgi:hypothetical protein